MIWTFFFVLIVTWFVSMIYSYTWGGYIHLLLVIAFAILLISLSQGMISV